MDAAEYIVKAGLKLGFDDVVSHVYNRRSSYLKISNSNIDSIVDKYSESASIFLASKKRIFFTNVKNPDNESIDNALQRAKSAIKLIKPKEDYYGIAQGPFKYRTKIPDDKKLERYSQDTLCDIAGEILNGASNNDNLAGTVHISSTNVELATNRNVYCKNSGTVLRISIRAFKNGLSLQNYAVSRTSKGVNPGKFSAQTIEILNGARKTGSIESGNYDVIYSQSPGGSLFSDVNSMASISNIETGSPFTKRLGETVASIDTTIYDSGCEKGAIEEGPCDDEGYPTQETPIIKDGILKNYLHNCSTSRKYKTKSTGNAGLSGPSPNTMVFKHKRQVKSIEELIRMTDHGLLVMNTWYTRYSNYFKGDFSTVPRDLAFYIENGEIKFAIKQGNTGSFLGIRISDNMINMLKNVDYVAKDTEQTTSWDSEAYYFMPSVLVRSQKVTVA